MYHGSLVLVRRCKAHYDCLSAAIWEWYSLLHSEVDTLNDLALRMLSIAIFSFLSSQERQLASRFAVAGVVEFGIQGYNERHVLLGFPLPVFVPRALRRYIIASFIRAYKSWGLGKLGDNSRGKNMLK
jgi:hypothetical protein